MEESKNSVMALSAAESVEEKELTALSRMIISAEPRSRWGQRNVQQQKAKAKRKKATTAAKKARKKARK